MSRGWCPGVRIAQSRQDQAHAHLGKFMDKDLKKYMYTYTNPRRRWMQFSRTCNSRCVLGGSIVCEQAVEQDLLGIIEMQRRKYGQLQLPSPYPPLHHPGAGVRTGNCWRIRKALLITWSSRRSWYARVVWRHLQFFRKVPHVVLAVDTL